VLKRAVGLDMKVAYYDIHRNEDLEKAYGVTLLSLEDVLKTSDFVSIHVPLLPATHHLINAERLALMKPTAYLINTSRGPVVDEEALAKALQAKTIAGAALDVYEHEPLVNPRLLQLENVVLTPHIASATKEARDAMAELAAQAIIMTLKGETPPNAIKS
jgi:glyoxylate reductase